MATTNPDQGHPAARIVAAVVAVLVGVPFLLTAYTALAGRFGARFDPHGYGMIFGTMAALVTGLVLSLVLPSVFPRRLRPKVRAWCSIGYVVVAAAMIALLLTA